MDATKKERFVLFGFVPILAAVLGAVVTVVVGQMTGGSGAEHNEVMLAIINAEGLTYDQKAKLMQMANEDTTKFYSWLSSVGMIVVIAIGYLGPAIARRISG